MKLEWDMIIALVIIAGCLALLFAGIDSEVKSILSVAAGWTFGSAFKEKRRK